ATGSQGAEGGTARSRARRGAAAETGDAEGGQEQGGGTRGGARKTGATSTARGRKSAQASGPDLRGDLREFISSRPHGWGHDDWTGLLGNLRERGHDVNDPDQIGRQLEQERLSHRLEQVEGLRPQQVRALSERFRTLWSLQQASVDEIAEVQNINRETAQRVHEQLR
ncbi:MAG TPA: helix-hairpin-helix domain-containing protein, partial [Longimicrobiaceae bacterium]|nr:helix-hairpin-helix domain-containing protein [Longimicrobiaceae bacterium]